MAWPTFPDGTVDWAQVFNDPDNGLINLVESADTQEKLKACYQAVIDGLYSRASDSEVREQFLQALDHQYDACGSPNDLPRLKTKITSLLQDIRYQRIERVRQYRKLAANDENRRMPKDDPLISLSALDD